MPSRRSVTSVACACLLLAGCGTRTPGDEEQVRDVLATFARATEARDYQRLCDEVFAPKLLEGVESIGLPCEVALRNSLGEVREPRLTVGEVELDGNEASAQVRTSAQGQEPSSDTVRLVRVQGKWRVSSLADPERATPTPTP